MEWVAGPSKTRATVGSGSPGASSTYSQRLSNRQLLEKIYLKLRRRFTPEEAAPTAILRCLQDGLERSIDAGIRLEAEQWSIVRRSPSTLNRLKTLHIARQKARHRIVNQHRFDRTYRGARSRIDGDWDRLCRRSSGIAKFSWSTYRPEASERSLQRMKKIAQQDAVSGLLKQETPDAFVEPGSLGP